MSDPVAYQCVLSLSSEALITSTHLYQMLYALQCDWTVKDCRFEAPSPGINDGSMENSTRLHIITSLTAVKVQEVWRALVESCPDLGLHCAWCEWGGYQGCVLRVGQGKSDAQ